MPEFTVKEVRLPELHLPEIKRDEIVRALSGVHLPDVDLAKARRTTIKVPALSLTGADIDRLITAGTALTRFARPTPSRVRAPWRGIGRSKGTPIAMIIRPRTRRSLRPIVFGAIVVAALAMWAILRRPAARQRLEAASRDARERLATWRAQDLRPDAAQGESRPVDADTAADVEGFANPTDDAGSPATGVNAHDVAARTGDTDGVPAFEESQKPS
jgi:hypothetical protein